MFKSSFRLFFLDDGSRRSEAGGQMSEVGSRRSDVGIRTSDLRPLISGIYFFNKNVSGLLSIAPSIRPISFDCNVSSLCFSMLI